MGLPFDRRADHAGMVYEGHERYDDIVFLDVAVEIGRGDVQGDGRGPRPAGNYSLGG